MSTTSATVSAAMPVQTRPIISWGLVKKSINDWSKDNMLSPSLLVGLDRDGKLRDAGFLAGVQHFGHALKLARAVAAHQYAKVGILLACPGELRDQLGE